MTLLFFKMDQISIDWLATLDSYTATGLFDIVIRYIGLDPCEFINSPLLRILDFDNTQEALILYKVLKESNLIQNAQFLLQRMPSIYSTSKLLLATVYGCNVATAAEVIKFLQPSTEQYIEPLRAAVYAQDRHMVELFIKHGASLDDICLVSTACCANDADMVKLLVKNCATIIANNGYSMVNYAIRHCSHAVVMALMEV